MTQRSIAPQPGETAVTAALRALAQVAGWCVTHTTDGQHSDTSLHYLGRAVDLADLSGPGWDSPQLLAINQAVLRLVPLPMLSEVIYAGPGAVCVKNGVILDGQNGRPTALAVYGATVLAEHHNHVHVGVPATFTYNGSQEITVPNDPNLPDTAGNCTGYFIFSHSTGELHSFGPGTRFYGRSEVVKLVTA
jgi:hypothetical protein